MSKRINCLVLALVMVMLTFADVFALPEFDHTIGRDQKIETLQKKGYLHGYADGSLKLEDKIKRSEFSTIIVYALEKQEEAKKLQGKEKPFTDVEKEYWANGIISVVKDEKSANNIDIIAGYPDGTFKPENKISNAEVIKMLVCLKKKDLTKEMYENATWPTSWIAWARELGIIGKDSNIKEDLDFSKEGLRGDVFTMFYNAFMEEEKTTTKVAKNSLPVMDIKDSKWPTGGGSKSHRSTRKESSPLVPLIPAETITPLEPSKPTTDEFTLKVIDEQSGIENLTAPKENEKYDKGTEISFTVKAVQDKVAKVEKIVGENSEELSIGEDGKYTFTITENTTIKLTYEDEASTCPTEDEVKNNFANAVEKAINKIILPEGLTQTFDKETRTSKVEINNLQTALENITGTNAIVKLKDLAANHGLKSFTIGTKTVDNIGEKSDEELKKAVIAALLNAPELQNLDITKADGYKKLEGKKIEATVKFESKEENCEREVTDNYKIVFDKVIVPEAPVSEEEKLKEDFANAVSSAIDEINFEGMTKTFNKETRTATVDIENLQTALENITGTNAIVKLKDLVANHGLKSFTIGTTTVDNLEEKSDKELKEAVIEALLNAPEINIKDSSPESIKKLEGMTITATVNFESTKDDKTVSASDDYKVKIGNITIPDKVEENN
ncbi:S-layer homology domain-containing protein [Peptoniphilus lacydonensis]|uniref:S-layer homology domain-containing protein n=1 Tax=Peptoniphilus lacydonensis TaxID=1673725 RepID=UPI002906721F|nr:S-layer homology domain-containing protein [Peptoniphilus lacydonensis]MDU5377320.1 S-layer homology domain-containing protein [Peptoniphilus lacydonensis]MDU5436229.1 S-layer homology domain-containing protein [Peptoniphilus lacydonensis]